MAPGEPNDPRRNRLAVRLVLGIAVLVLLLSGALALTDAARPAQRLGLVFGAFVLIVVATLVSRKIDG